MSEHLAVVVERRAHFAQHHTGIVFVLDAFHRRPQHREDFRENAVAHHLNVIF
jgi:hypothetical protein